MERDILNPFIDLLSYKSGPRVPEPKDFVSIWLHTQKHSSPSILTHRISVCFITNPSPSPTTQDQQVIYEIHESERERERERERRREREREKERERETSPGCADVLLDGALNISWA